jgi:hypothetical protein
LIGNPFHLFTFFIDKKVTKNLVYRSFSVKLAHFFYDITQTAFACTSPAAKLFGLLRRPTLKNNLFYYEKNLMTGGFVLGLIL